MAILVAENTDPEIPDGVMSTMRGFTATTDEQWSEYLDGDQMQMIQMMRQMGGEPIDDDGDDMADEEIDEPG